jgi:spermidine synthase
MQYIVNGSGYGLQSRYSIKKKILTKITRHQHVEIIDNGYFGRMLFLDKDLQTSELDSQIYSRELLHPIKTKKLGKVAILGGGDGGVLRELLKHRPKSVCLVDIDEDVINYSRKYLKKICGDSFDDKAVKIITDDASRFLEGCRGFDLILYCLTMAPERLAGQKRNVYAEKIFLNIRKSLIRGGALLMQCGSELDRKTLDRLGKVLDKNFRHVKYHSAYIPSFMENWVFAEARKPTHS